MKTIGVVAGGILAAAVGAGCTGYVAPVSPGGDTSLDPDFNCGHCVGPLAVETDLSHVWLMHGGTRTLSDGSIQQRELLAAVDPVSGNASEVLDLSGSTDHRLIFPGPGRALLLDKPSTGYERLTLLDTATLGTLGQQTQAGVFNGTRTSPSGRFLVVADSSQVQPPLVAIGTTSLQSVVIPAGGDALEAMWDHGSDSLLAIAVDQPFGSNPSGQLLRFRDVSSVGSWPAPDLDLTFSGYGWDLLFSYTWIGISPDDHWAVFPVIREADGAHVLLVLDQVSGTLRTVAGSGPVGFTPDSSTIVSYQNGSPAELLMIDVTTLQSTTVPVPGLDTIDYYVTGAGNFVVVSNSLDQGQIVIYDQAAGKTTSLGGGGRLGLREFVVRPGHDELWMAADDYGLYKLDYSVPSLSQIGVGVEVNHLNILPSQDRLALAPPDGGTLSFYNMGTSQVDLSVTLPGPFNGMAQVSRPGTAAPVLKSRPLEVVSPAYSRMTMSSM